jgi:mono/diheme cytochrome c family protein
VLRLTREPRALIAAEAGGGELASRMRTLLGKLAWPGKTGEADPAPPLAPEEQARFAAGVEVYTNLCQACHQPDGRGQEKVAPPLVGSILALAPAEVPIRILLHGKEGATGLMPPIGGTLTDDQIAAVLTYVRREWGQNGTPVDPARVKAVRATTAGRTRPWTDAELAALMTP